MCMMFWLHVCLHITCMPIAYGGQKSVSDTLELEFRWLRADVWALGLEPRSSAGTNASNHGSIPAALLAPLLLHQCARVTGATTPGLLSLCIH